MIPTSPTSSTVSFASHLAFFNGQWIPHERIGLPISDLGFRQGVTVVERLRTYHAKPFELGRHADRWRQSLTDLRVGCEISQDRFVQIVDQLIAENLDLVQQAGGDVGITLFATPQSHAAHLNPIDAALVGDRMANGQAVVCTEYQSPPNASWPRRAKARSRIHYYLADLQATDVATNASGLLLDQDGSVTETSVSNLAIVESGVIVSPPQEKVLPGVTQQVCEELAKNLSISWRHEPISPERLRVAEAVLLMGTDTGVWFANQIFSAQSTAKGTRYEDHGRRQLGEVGERLQNAFTERTKLAR